MSKCKRHEREKLTAASKSKLVALSAMLFARIARSADAQQPGKVLRIGYPRSRHCFR